MAHPRPHIPAVRPAPRQTMERKLVLWTVTLVVVPMFLCATWFNRLAARSMSEHHARNVVVIGRTLAASLAGKVGADSAQAVAELFDSVEQRHRLVFLFVQDIEGNVILRRTADLQAWHDYSKWLDQRGGKVETDNTRTIKLRRYGELVVQRLPVWNPPFTARAGGGVSDPVNPELEGYVTVAMLEPRLPQMVAELWSMQVAAAGVVCALCIPIAVFGARRWTAPIRSLLRAIDRLTQGETPEPIVVRSRDELGVLADAFNHMTESMLASQAALRHANEDLEHKVDARTSELQKLNDRLETELRDKNDFLRTVTHDLNAPVRNISGMATMLLAKYESQLADDAVNKLQRITANAKAQSDLLADLLELSRIRTRPGRREDVDLHKLVADIRDQMSFDLESGGIELAIETELPTVHAERTRMRQVFQNLLDNAVKYMGDNPDKRITVRAEQRDDEWQFTVADTGRGIDAKDHAQVFNVFRRGSEPAVHKIAGKGVGLASVKTIVECYGGKIWVESKRGEGSRFHFTLALSALQPLAA